MPTARSAGFAASLLTIGLTVVACSNGAGTDRAEEQDKSTASSTRPSDEVRNTSDVEPESSSTPSEPAADAVVIEVKQEGGTIEPLGDTVKADVGQQILLVVDSDASDELHVHSEPEKSFEVVAAQDQRFSFTIEAPGTYDVESHSLGVVVVKLQVS